MALQDAELIALGKQLEEIQKRMAPLEEEHARLANAAHEFACLRTGYDPSPGSVPTRSLLDEYYAVLREMQARNGADACSDKLEALDCELDPIIRKIMHLPATTISGLGIKALATIQANRHLWRDNLDWDDEAVRSLTESVCALAGLPPPQEKPCAPEGFRRPGTVHPGSATLN
jgi:hypothetical protein